MKYFKKHSKNPPLRHIRLSNWFMPSHDSRVTAYFRKMIAFWWVAKIVGVAGGIFLIGWMALILGNAYAAIPPILLTGVTKMTASFLPFFMDLITASLLYLWQPILVYLLIAVLTRSQVWRKFWCLVGFSGFFLTFVTALETSTWQEYQVLPLLILQGYLFLLWLLPREVWNIIGLLISVFLGLIVLILPDLPTAFDDFGIFGAILAFFLGYLNALASLIQRVVRWV
jgi:hypothetical protein